MTRSKPAIPAPPTFAASPRQLEVRWSTLVHARFDAFGACDSVDAVNGESHRRVELVIAIQLLADERAMLEAWLELPHGRRIVFPRRPLACSLTVLDGLLHLDCAHEGRRLIALTRAADGSVVYAQSDLLADAGFRGGTFDPPSIRPLETRHDAASA